MRKVNFIRGFTKNPAGSVLASFGDTKVLCTCSIEEKVPPFVEKGGWLTAEYSMLPGSVSRGRKKRDGLKKDGRSVEIQRLIARSLRAAVNLEDLPQITIIIDCDVLQADGGTRTASISGGWVALMDGLDRYAEKTGEDMSGWIAGQVAAVSVGISGGGIICDLDYDADRVAAVDMNIVTLDSGFVEIQGTGEHGTFSEDQLVQLLASAREGLEIIRKEQLDSLKSDI